MLIDVTTKTNPGPSIVTGRNGTHNLAEIRFYQYADGKLGIDGIGVSGRTLNAGFYLDHISADRFLKDLVLALASNKIIVEVQGGVAYCDDPRVEIIDHDNREEEDAKSNQKSEVSNIRRSKTGRRNEP